MSAQDFHSGKLVRAFSWNTLSRYKPPPDALWAVIIGAVIMLPYIWGATYLDTRVYQPAGSISEDTANTAKWIACLVFLPLALLALAGYLVAPLCLLLALCYRKRPRRPLVLLTVGLVFVEIIAFAHIQGNWSHRIFREAFVNVAVSAQDLIWAIETYKESEGNYPPDLRSLMSKFISEIPDTGLAGYPTFRYKTANADTIFKKYELLVDTPSGGINFDVFVYWPEGNYPEYFYGGVLELIENWAYVHE